MSEQFLHGADVVAVLEQMGGERMSQRVRSGALGDPDPARGVLDRSLQDRLVQVMPAEMASQPVAIEARGGEDPLPDPFPSGVRILSQERGRQLYPPGTLRQVVLVLGADVREVPDEVAP